MPTFYVMGLLHANTVSETVQARDANDAASKAEGWPSLCFECARGVELGDLYGYIVTDANHDMVRNDADAPTWQERARAAGWAPPEAD